MGGDIDATSGRGGKIVLGINGSSDGTVHVRGVELLGLRDGALDKGLILLTALDHDLLLHESIEALKEEIA